ncbi:MAG: hypothetical protein AAF986_04830, partial [Pseudomonadota bacterium]
MTKVPFRATLAIVAMTSACSAPTPAAIDEDQKPMVVTRQSTLTPPKAEMRPQEITQHGHVRTDKYGWLR